MSFWRRAGIRWSLRLLAMVLVAGLAGGAATLAWKYHNRPGMAAVEAHRYASPPAGARSLHATWFGTTALLLSDGDHSLFVDPFFTRPAGWLPLILNGRIAPDEDLIERSLRNAGVRNLDAVLVSHSHFDHAMDAAVVARMTGATLVGSASTANIGRGGGVPESHIWTVGNSEPLAFGPFSVHFIPSRHAGATGGRPTGEIGEPLVPPARYLDYRQGGTYSLLIEHPLGTVLVHGSAGFIPGILKDYRAEVVFLGIALIDDLPVYLQEVVNVVEPRRVIPVHWDDFTRPLSEPLRPSFVGVDLPAFFDGMKTLEPRLQVLTLKPGEPVVLFVDQGATDAKP